MFEWSLQYPSTPPLLTCPQIMVTTHKAQRSEDSKTQLRKTKLRAHADSNELPNVQQRLYIIKNHIMRAT